MGVCRFQQYDVLASRVSRARCVQLFPFGTSDRPVFIPLVVAGSGGSE